MKAKNKSGTVKSILFPFLLCVGILGCVAQQAIAVEPGLYDFKGWNYQSCWKECSSDIDGKVGYRLYVEGPRARCEPSRNWNMKEKITSGNLPPGLTIDSRNSHIEGIPQKRGHWIVRMKIYDLECGGAYYEGKMHELRFHITGSGRVNQ